MKKLIRELFFLRKGERRALYVVVVILFLSAVFRSYMANRPLPSFEPDPVFVQHMEAIQRQIDSALQQEQLAEADALERRGTGKWGNRRKQQPGGYDPANAPLTPVSFDPNTISYDMLLSMNLSGYVSRNIVSYRKAGGTFQEPGDLEKIYGLSKEEFHTLVPYMVFPEQTVEAAAPGGRFNTDPRPNREGRSDSSGRNIVQYDRFGAWSDTIFPIELNSVDSAGLIALPGIGPWFAGRIIRYRELLGGYLHPEQLLEVYGMDTTRFSGMVQFVTADTARIRRIDLNNSSFQQIISHPYISREETYSIFRYMDFVDTIRHPENLLQDQIIDRERFMRMAPYLTVKSEMD